MINMNLQEQINRIQEMMGLINEEITQTLKLGSLGDDVNELQKTLGIFEDGKFGKQTEECVKQFQRAEPSIDDDGVVGPITIDKIKKFQEGKVTWIPSEYCKSEKSKNVETQITTISSKENEKTSNNDDSNVILMGGLDYRSGDKNINQQVSLLKSTAGNKKIIGFRYNDPSSVENAIKDNPNATVVLFSAGCGYASKMASLIGDKNKLFIVEPYAVSSGTANSVKNAVSQGVPVQNVVTGPIPARGKGVVDGSTKTPNGIDHWGALEYVGNLI